MTLDWTRCLDFVQRDNPETDEPHARNALRSSRVGSTVAYGCLWAIAGATGYSARLRSGRPLFGEALVREG